MESQGNDYKDLYNLICVSARKGPIMNLMHGLLEKKHRKSHFAHVLEVGAHRGEHLSYVKHSYDTYTLSDIQVMLPEEIHQLPKGVKFVSANVESLPFDDSMFDRVISTCVLHHLSNLDDAIDELVRVCKPGGVISILLPTDPGLTYRGVKFLGSGIRAKKLGLLNQVKLFHAREHRNHYHSIAVILRAKLELHPFKVKFWPFRVPSWNLNALTIWEIRKADFHD